MLDSRRSYHDVKLEKRNTSTTGEPNFIEVDLTNHSRDISDTLQCAICLSAFHEGTPVCSSIHSDCNHCYHKDCIIPWLLKHEDCPYCRGQYIDLDELMQNQTVTLVIMELELATNCPRATIDETEV